MDQNSSNDTEKRNWRERLGIGNKDMPRISNEFAKAPEILAADAAPVRPAQAVAKPAPMAPRMPMKAGTAPAARPQQQVLPQGAAPQPPDALAEKLRSQRAAAERLAEQRVTAAKLRAENAPSTPAPVKTPVAPIVAAGPAEKPKFSFADEDVKADFGREPRTLPPSRPPQRPAPQQPQLSPPRPPLGGQPRIPAGAPAAGFQPQYRPQPPRGYSPSAYVPPPPLSQPQRSFNSPLAQPPVGEPRLHAPRVNPDAYRRGPQDDLGYAGAGYETSHRSLQQRTAALRAPAYDDDYGDEIFEDAPPSRSQRRASASDYNQAYRETEGVYGEERKRSSGPWLMLLFMLLAAGAGGAGIWYYNTNVKSVAATGAADTVPVVSAPEQSAKSAPEQPLDGQPAGATTSKKQIYDRIIGDNEVLGGQVVPTEETPIQPEARQGDAEPIPEPAGGFDSFSEGGDALPLPMPPPPGSGNDTQGSLSAPPAKNTVALSSPATATNATASTSTAPDTDIAPVPGETAAAAANQQATPPAAPAPATEEIVDEEPAPVIKKPAAKKAKAVAENAGENLGAAPVVLVPPADPAEGGQIASAPLVVDQPVATQPAPVVKKKKTLLGLFRGTNDDAPAAQAAPGQQVASIPQPEPAPLQQQAAPAQVASAGSGYFVQLASFKSQAEASAEFGRLKAKHGAIIGTLPSSINPATVGGSTRYRLAVGPVTSRDQATRICASLVAAGERDCLVRRQ